MKFTLIVCLIGFGCAVLAAEATPATQIQPRLGDFGIGEAAINKMKLFLEIYVNTVKKSGDLVISEAEDIMKNVNEQLDKLYIQAQKTLVPIIKHTMDKVEEMTDNYDNAVDCIAEQKDRIASIVRESPMFLYQCVETAMEESNHFLELIRQHVENVMDYTDTITDTLNECLETTGTVYDFTVCVTGRAKLIFNHSMELIKDTKDLLKDGAKTSVKIVFDASNCLPTTTIAIQQALLDVVKDIQVCIVH